MTKVTYVPRHSGDPLETEWDGRSFQANKPIEYDGRAKEHAEFIKRARLNPWFEVDGESASVKSASDPTTAEEYRAYVIDWVNKSKSSREMDARWRSEQDLRDTVGWGSDDQALIEPFYAPKLENLKAAEGA